MATLTPAAKAEVKYAGLTLRDFARGQGWADNAVGRWYGDACGCSDDRCIGYHHDEGDDCECLPVMVDYAIEWRSTAACGRGDVVKPDLVSGSGA